MKTQNAVKSLLRWSRFVWFGMLLLNISFLSSAQNTTLETDKGLQVSIAGYDADVRQAILVASQYPAVLSEMQQTKTNTQNSFHFLINDFSQKKQGWFYELSRFPELTHTLASLPRGKSRDEINALLPNQDETLTKAAWRLYKHHQQDVQQLDQLYQQAEADFQKNTASLDANTQAAFRTLAKFPDVLVLLTDNITLTSQLGQQYASNKEAFAQQLAAKHDSLVIQNQAQIAAYQKALAQNPQAKQELNQAARDFARSNGYILPNGQVVYGNGYGYANPYSYWFGYPTWYGTALWYPSAYWSSFGLSYGFGGLGISAFPSWGFSNWFFNAGYYYNYPYLYNSFGNYRRPMVVRNTVAPVRSVNTYRNDVVRNYNYNGGSFRSFGGRSFGGGGRRR